MIARHRSVVIGALRSVKRVITKTGIGAISEASDAVNAQVCSQFVGTT
jgi:hypothetical protein